MNRTHALWGAAALACASTAVPDAHAADHIDSPAAVAEPAADISDLYAWTNADADKLNLIMNVFPFAGEDSAFSTAVQYAFHVNSSAGFGEAQSETLVLCQWYAADGIECWAGDEYVAGDPSDPAGLVSDSGKLRVFAGRRNDPFFFELTGFNETVKAVIAAGQLPADDEGCPTLDADTQSALVGQLQSGADGAEASDTLAGASILSLAVQVDTDVVDAGGPVLGVWASTHGKD